MKQNKKKKRKNNKILSPIYLGIFASLCWIIGDLLLVGFTPQPDKYPLLSQTYASQIDVDFATLMLSGSTNRLMWGALLAVFSIPFYLYSTFAFGHIVKRKWKVPVFLLLFFGFAYAPLGHAAFFYVGEIYKAILNTDVSAHPQLLETANSFMKVLKINWATSLTMTFIGWLVYGISVAMGKTIFKRSTFWINPITFVLLIMIIVQFLPSPIKDWLACAIFNYAHFIFFITLILTFKTIKSKSKPD